MRAFGSHPVETGRFQPLGGAGHEAHEIVPVVVAQDEDDVSGSHGRGRRIGPGGRPGEGQEQGGKEREPRSHVLG